MTETRVEETKKETMERLKALKQKVQKMCTVVEKDIRSVTTGVRILTHAIKPVDPRTYESEGHKVYNM